MMSESIVVHNGTVPDVDASPKLALPVTIAPQLHQPTRRSRKLVKGMVAAGLTQEQIGNLLDLSVETLVKHYPKELVTGLEEAVSSASRSLYRRGMKGDTNALIFWMKARAKWRDRDPNSINVAQIMPETQTAKLEVTQVESAILKALANLRPSPKLIQAKVLDNQPVTDKLT